MSIIKKKTPIILKKNTFLQWTSWNDYNAKIIFNIILNLYLNRLDHPEFSNCHLNHIEILLHCHHHKQHRRLAASAWQLRGEDWIANLTTSAVVLLPDFTKLDSAAKHNFLEVTPDTIVLMCLCWLRWKLSSNNFRGLPLLLPCVRVDIWGIFILPFSHPMFLLQNRSLM